MLEKAVRIKPLRVLGGRTVADDPENWSRWRKRPIELAEAPEDPTEGSRILAIERITMIEIDHHGQRGLGIRRPVE